MDTFTTREAARLLGVSRRTFNRWIETHAVERETGYGPSGVEYRYTRAALEHILHQVRGEGAASQLDEGSPTGGASEPAQGRQGVSSGVGQDGTPAQVLALPVPPEVLDLLADLRDVVARAAGAEVEVGAVKGEVQRLGGQVERLAEVLAEVAARLPAPTAAPRVRWRSVAEVALLAVVVTLAGAMVAAVARVL